MLGVIDLTSHDYAILVYFDVSNFKLIIDTLKGSLEYSLDVKQVDSIWYFLYTSVYNTQLISILYNTLSTTFMATQTLNYPLDLNRSQVGFQIGGYGTVYTLQKEFQFILFQGYFSKILINKILTNQPAQLQLSDCLSTCALSSQSFNDYQLDGSQTFEIVSDKIFEKAFSFQAWFKITYIGALQTYEALRIRVNQYQNEIQQLGDQSLLIQYQIQSTQVVVIFTSESYSTPITQNYIFNPQYQVQQVITIDQAKNWHYIGFYYDRTQQFQTYVKMYLKSGVTYTLTWPIQLYMFAGNNLYFEVGGSTNTQNKFIGQIYQGKLQQCVLTNYQINILCHVSCKTCSGPNYYDCLSCDSTLHRTLTINGICTCEEGYYSVIDTNQCFALSDSTQLQINQVNAIGINCKFGEVKINNICIKCPSSFDTYLISCIDCLLNANTWIQNGLCTKDYGLVDQSLINSPYKEIENQQQYFIDLSLGQALVCQECDSICSTIGSDCFKSNYFHLGQQVNIKCKLGYYFDNGFCQFCTTNCNKCSGGICSQCKDGYYLQNNQCIQCDGLICQQYNNYVVTCPTTPAQTNVNGICVLCGYLCEACQTYQDINRCLRCSSGYHVSLDGINCQQNTINNCQYEYLRASSGESTIPPLFDYNDQVEYKPICLKCTTNFYNLQTSQCDTNTLNNCNYSIQDGSGTIQCVIGTTIGIQKTDCSITNCEQCADNYCIVCNEGYYSNYYTGLCQKCQSDLNCNSCQQEFENVYWEIYSVYKFITGTDLKQQQLKNTQLTVKCLSCLYSYQLYNQQCINECPSNCKQCKIINNQNTCISCIGEYGIIQSQNCVECGQYCQACQPNRSDIATLNPYLLPGSLHTKYSYMCYKPNDTGTSFNNQFKTFVKCSGTLNCSKVLTLKYKLYCSQTDYTNDYNANSDKDQFSKENYYLNNLDQIFNTFESFEFFQFLNRQSITQMDIHITFIDNLLIPQCSFSKSIKLEQKFSSNVFLLTQVNVALEGSNVILQVFDLSFINFSQLSINGLIFQIQTNKIKLQNLLDTNLVVTNSKFVSKDNSNNQCLQFDFSNPNSLTINNVEIRQAYFSNCQLFNSFKIITIQQLNFISSQFLNFKLIGQLNNLISLTLQDITINSTFTNSTLIHQNNKSITNINGLIIKSTIYQSILMKFQQCCLTLSQITIYDSKIQQNTAILEIQQLTLSNLIFYNNLVESSIIFNSSSLISNSIKMSNLQFSSSDIKQQSKLIYLDQVNSDFQLNTIKLNGLTNSNNFINNHIIIMNGLTISIYEFILDRKIGNPELQLNRFKTIKLDYVRITQNPEYFVYLNPSYECFKQYSNNLQYSNIITINQAEQILLNDIKITRMNIFNESFIDVSQVTTLTIQNSVFSDNLLIVTDSQILASIISVSTDKVATINIANSYFYNNTLSKYAIDQIYQSSATLSIDAVYSISTIKSSSFLYNKVFNSSNTILYVKSDQIIMENLKFSNNNKFNSAYLKSHLADSFPAGTSLESIMDTFPINSLGGNGYFIASNITQNALTLDTSYASLGGCFYYNMQDSGFVNIANSLFSNTQASLKAYSNSKGGCLYIDGSDSNLVVTIETSIFQNSYSRYEGGSIYVLCSSSQCEIQFNQIQAFDNLALSGGFVYLDFQEQNQFGNFNDIILRTSSKSVAYLFNYCEQMTLIESKIFYLSGGLITASKGQVNLNNIQFQQGNTFGGISLISNGGASLNKVKFTNFVKLQNPLIQITVSDQFLNNKVFVENIHISLITDDSTYYAGCSTSQYSIPTPSLLCNGNVQSTLNYQTGISSGELSYMNYCNKNQLFYKIDTNIKYNLFKIMNVMHIQNSKLILNMLTITDCNVENVASSSLIYIGKILESDYQIIKISNINLLNSKFTFGLTIVSYYFSSTFSRLLQQQQNNNRLLQITSNTIPTQVVVSQAHMMNNSYTGYLIQSLYLQVTFTDIYLINNINNFQYSISINDDFQRYFNSVVTENIATTQYCSPAVYDEYPLQELLKSKFFIHFNKGNDTDSGDIYEVIQGLSLAYGTNKTQLKRVSKKDNSQIIDMIQISPYKILGYSELQQYLTLPSGQEISQYSYYDPYTLEYIPYNLSLYLVPLNRYGQAVPPAKTFANKNCTVNQRLLDTNDPESELNTNFTFLFNVTIGSSPDFLINLNSLQITFNPYLEKSKYLQLQFKCPFVKIYEFSDTFPYASSSQPLTYELRANFRSFYCQVGEYFIQNQCKPCDPNQQQYSVQVNQTQCFLKDDVSTLEVTQSKLNLKSGFWRYLQTSTIIEQCYHLTESCLGGWTPGDPSCITGHIGALCEQCDIYNTRGSGSYSVSSQYKCGNCNEQTLNIIIFVLVSLFTIGCALVTVKSSISDTEELLITRRVKAFAIREAPKGAQATILLKMLTNYFQIIATIFTFQLALPPEIEVTSNGIGNPVESMIYSLECVLATWTSIDIMYFRVIWMIITPFLFIFLILFIYVALVCLRLVKYYVGVLTTTCIYMYIYMQPNIIQGLITLLSRRNISGVDFVQANVSHAFDSYTHYKWCIMLVLPGTLFFAILVPLFLWSRVYSFRTQLDSFQARYRWGYLYNEYTTRAYYWETVRLLEKQLIIIGLNYYEDYIPIKASITLLIVFLYQLFSNRVQPFYTVPLNKLDTFSTIVCSISIILCSSIYTASQIGQNEIIWPFYILTALLNAIFILTIIKQLINAYFIQFNDKFDRIKEFIKEKFPNLVERTPWLIRCLETQREKQKRIDHRYGVLKNHLLSQSKQIVKMKKLVSPSSPDQVVESFMSRRSQFYQNNNSPYISRISRVSLHKNSTNTNQRQQSPSVDSETIISPQAQRVYVNQINSNIQSSRIQQPYFSRVELPQTSVLISPSNNDQDEIDVGIQMQITANNIQMYEYQKAALSEDIQQSESIANRSNNKQKGQD